MTWTFDINMFAKESLTNLFKTTVQNIEKRKNPSNNPKLIHTKDKEKIAD